MTKILFICVYNSGRSQIAEALLRDTLVKGKLLHEDVQVMSAGIAQGAGVLPNVRVAMREIGISMEGHHSKLLTDEMLKEADIIVATCDEVCVAIPKEIEETKRILKWNLAPPVGTLEEVRLIRDEIKELVEELAKTLEQNIQ